MKWSEYGFTGTINKQVTGSIAKFGRYLKAADEQFHQRLLGKTSNDSIAPASPQM
jgi:hypothetical protein